METLILINLIQCLSLCHMKHEYTVYTRSKLTDLKDVSDKLKQILAVSVAKMLYQLLMCNFSQFNIHLYFICKIQISSTIDFPHASEVISQSEMFHVQKFFVCLILYKYDSLFSVFILVDNMIKKYFIQGQEE